MGALARTHRQDKNPLDYSTRITWGLGGSYWVHKTRGPSGTGFRAKARPKSLNTIGQKDGLVADQKVWTKRSGARSSTPSAHHSDRSTRFGLQMPSDALFDRKAWPKVLLPTPTLHPSDQGS